MHECSECQEGVRRCHEYAAASPWRVQTRSDTTKSNRTHSIGMINKALSSIQMHPLLSSSQFQHGAQVERRSKMGLATALGVRSVAPRSLLVATGRTVNRSSSGSLVASQRQMSVGERVELFVDWLVMRNGTTPLQLVALGNVVRAEAGVFAVSLKRYELGVRCSGT